MILKKLNLKMTTYVDNINTHHTNTDKSNNIEYNMRHDYNNWKSLLEASGGQLAPEKCNYYITQWTFQANRKLKMELARATQHIDSISEVINPIQTLHQSLGINISPENLVLTQQNLWIDREKHTLNILKTTEKRKFYTKQYTIPKFNTYYHSLAYQRKTYNKSLKIQ
jgi:hypothetical protein